MPTVSFEPTSTGPFRNGDTVTFLLTQIDFPDNNGFEGAVVYDADQLSLIGSTINPIFFLATAGEQPVDASGETSVPFIGGAFPVLISGTNQVLELTFLVVGSGDTDVEFVPAATGFSLDASNQPVEFDGDLSVNIVSNEVPGAQADSATTEEEASVSIDVLDNDIDPDGDDLTIQSFTQAANGTVTEVDGELVYTPDTDFVGFDSFEYTAADPSGETSTATVNVEVTNVNDAPTANDDAVTTFEDQPIVVDVLGNDVDVDGDALVVSSVTQGTNGTVTLVDGVVTYTPNPEFSGTDSFLYEVSDGNIIDVASVNVNIVDVLDAPVTLTLSEGTGEPGTSIFFEVRTPSDFPDFAAFSANLTYDADVLTFVGADFNEALNLPFVGVEPGDASGEITIEGALQAAILNPGAPQLGGDELVVTIEFEVESSGNTDIVLSDFNGMFLNFANQVVFDEDIETSVVLNTPPEAEDDVVTVDEDDSISIDVLANDSDADDDPISIESFTEASNGQVQLIDGKLVYTPDDDYNGPDSFTYAITDGISIVEATVDITVTPVDDAPIAGDDVAETDEDNAILISVFDNDADADNDPLNIVPGVTALNGTVEIVEGGLLYTPDANFFGVETFTYEVEDGTGLSDTAEVTVTVNSVEDIPVAAADTATLDEDTETEIDVLSNDSDGDGDALSISEFTQAANGTVSIGENGGLLYTANADFNGSDSFEYVVTDTNGNTATATVDVTVNAIDDAPIIGSGDSFEFVEGDTAPVFTATATDADGDAILFSLEGEDAGLFDIDAVTGEVAFAETPAFDDEGDNVFNITVVASDEVLEDALDVTIALLKDSDGDLVHDGIDNAIFVANADQRDSNGDGVGNVIDGDFNGDGFVGTSDAITLINFFGAGTPVVDGQGTLIDGVDAAADADFDGDGVVGLSDLGAFRTLFGQELGAHAPTDEILG